jgi:hypothetical protein
VVSLPVHYLVPFPVFVWGPPGLLATGSFYWVGWELRSLNAAFPWWSYLSYFFVYSKLAWRQRLVLHLDPLGAMSPILKIEKWFPDNYLGMRYCNQTWCLASLYEDHACNCILTPVVNVTVTKSRTNRPPEQGQFKPQGFYLNKLERHQLEDVSWC